MLPGDAAGELLADPQHALLVTYGCLRAVRTKMFPFAICVSTTFSSSVSAKSRLSVAFSRSSGFEPLILRYDLVWSTRQPGRPSSGRPHGAFQWPAEPKHYRRWKVCRTQGEQPISRGEYSPSGREQLVRQRLYPSVTI